MLQFRYTFCIPQTKRLRARKIGLQYSSFFYSALRASVALQARAFGCPSGNNPLSLNFHQQILQSDLHVSIYFGHTRTDFISLSHSRVLAMTDARSCLERPLSLSSWSINVVSGRPLERLLCFGSQSVSWETVSFLLLQQWPLNYRRRFWRLIETGGKSLLDVWSLQLMFTVACSSLISIDFPKELFEIF